MSKHPLARRVTVAAIAVVVVVVVVGIVLTLRDTSRPVSIDEARERTTSTTGADDEPSALPRPAPGVYRYEGSGTESLSTPPLSQDQGPTMPATVEWSEGGCWTFRIDYSSNHWQSWRYCPRGDSVSEVEGSSWQRWMIGATAITNQSDFRCEQGSVVLLGAGDTRREWDARCTGTSDTVPGTTLSAGPYQLMGEEPIEVDGTRVRTRHFRSERTMTGAQTGTERSDVWFALDTGLPVRNERSVTASSDSPIGPVSYTEEGRFSLVATEPG